MKKLSEDVEAIAAALRESKELLEVSEDGLKVRRKTELPDDLDINAHGVYIKGFAKDATLDEIIAQLEEKSISPKCVRMQYYKEKGGKKFKGSVFAFLKSDEDVEAAMKAELGEGFVIKTKTEYESEKATEVKEDAPVEDSKFAATEFTKGLLFKLSGLVDSVRRELLREWVEKVGGSVAYVEFEMGKTEAVIRLAEDSSIKAAEAVEKLEAIAEELKTANGDQAVACAVVEGDEETAAWEAIEKAKAGKREHFGQKRKSEGRFKRGGRDNKRTRR
jgi:hypothetical protein